MRSTPYYSIISIRRATWRYENMKIQKCKNTIFLFYKNLILGKMYNVKIMSYLWNSVEGSIRKENKNCVIYFTLRSLKILFNIMTRNGPLQGLSFVASIFSDCWIIQITLKDKKDWLLYLHSYDFFTIYVDYLVIIMYICWHNRIKEE